MPESSVYEEVRKGIIILEVFICFFVFPILEQFLKGMAVLSTSNMYTISSFYWLFHSYF